MIRLALTRRGTTPFGDVRHSPARPEAGKMYEAQGSCDPEVDVHSQVEEKSELARGERHGGLDHTPAC